jgi:hypothetical protein
MTARQYWFAFILLGLGAPHALRAADDADPKAVAVEFYTAVGRGDAKAAKELSITGPREEKWIDANAAMNGGFKRLYSAALEKFGPEGAKRFAEKSPAEYSAELVEKSPARQQQDEAGIIVNEKTGAAIVLTRRDGKWRMDWVKGMKDKDLRPQTALYTRMADSLNSVTDGIRAGKYATAPDAERDLKAGFLKAAGSQPTTAP